MKISSDFTIEDIHNIRYANYERTKDMSKEELIEDSRKKAENIRKKLAILKNTKITVS